MHLVASLVTKNAARFDPEPRKQTQLHAFNAVYRPEQLVFPRGLLSLFLGKSHAQHSAYDDEACGRT
jgi:hypothetical protein